MLVQPSIVNVKADVLPLIEMLNICEGTHFGRCPSNKRGPRSVKLIHDIELCVECASVRFPPGYVTSKPRPPQGLEVVSTMNLPTQPHGSVQSHRETQPYRTTAPLQPSAPPSEKIHDELPDVSSRSRVHSITGEGARMPTAPTAPFSEHNAAEPVLNIADGSSDIIVSELLCFVVTKVTTMHMICWLNSVWTSTQ